MNDGNNVYLGVLLEEIREQNQVLLEVASSMQKRTSRLPYTEKNIETLVQDMKVVKAAVTDMSIQQQNHDRRLSQFESAT